MQIQQPLKCTGCDNLLVTLASRLSVFRGRHVRTFVSFMCSKTSTPWTCTQFVHVQIIYRLRARVSCCWLLMDFTHLEDMYDKSVLTCHGRAYCLLRAMTVPHLGATGWPPTITAWRLAVGQPREGKWDTPQKPSKNIKHLSAFHVLLQRLLIIFNLNTEVQCGKGKVCGKQFHHHGIGNWKSYHGFDTKKGLAHDCTLAWTMSLLAQIMKGREQASHILTWNPPVCWHAQHCTCCSSS